MIRLGGLLALWAGLASAAPPERIVTLTPHATELVALLDASRLVAVDQASDYPPAVAHLPRLAAYPEPSLEALLALRPQLVLTWSPAQRDRLAQRLRHYGIQVEALTPDSPAAVAAEIRKLGRWLGLTALAERMAEDYLQRLQAVEQPHAGRAPLRVFLQLGEKPLRTAAGQSFLSQTLSRCGAQNVFASLAAPSPLVSLEAVLAAQPELILATGPADSLRAWQRFPGLPAVRRGQLDTLTDDTLLRPGPRLPEGMARLCARIEQARLAKIP